MLGLILFGGFAFFLVLGLPVGFGLALASVAAIFYKGFPIALFGQRMFTAVDSFPLMAIPLFMLAGSLMGHGGITRRIINFTLSFVGNVRGQSGPCGFAKWRHHGGHFRLWCGGCGCAGLGHDPRDERPQI